MRRMDGDVVAATAAARIEGGREVGGGVCTAYPMASRMANVVGTSNVPLGFRFRKPASSALALKPRESPIGYNHEAEVRALLRDEDVKRKRFVLMMQEAQRDQWKVVREEIKKRVELGMEAYDLELEEKRERLRELLLREEAHLTRELVEAARRLEEERAAELARQAAEAAEEAEAAKLVLLQEKKLQRYSEQSMELREARRRAWTEDAKLTNRIQIAEAEEKRRREREDKEFWEKLTAELTEAADAAEADACRKRVEREQATARKLQDQIREREMRRLVPRPAELSALPIGSLDETMEEKRDKQRKRKEELDRQLAESKRCIGQRCQEEKALDEMTAIFSKPEPGYEQVRRDKEARLRETLAFMRNMKEFREAIARRETEAEKCLGRLAEEAELRRREIVKRSKEERARHQRDAKISWDKQLREKRERIRIELEADRNQAEDAGPSKQEEKVRLRKAAKEYGRELKAQQECIDERRARELRQLDEALKRQLAEREREDNEMARELELRDDIRPKICGTS